MEGCQVLLCPVPDPFGPTPSPWRPFLLPLGSWSLVFQDLAVAWRPFCRPVHPLRVRVRVRVRVCLCVGMAVCVRVPPPAQCMGADADTHTNACITET